MCRLMPVRWTAALVAVMLPWELPSTGGEPPDGGEVKSAAATRGLPESRLAEILEEQVRELEAATKSPEEFKKRTRFVQNTAMLLGVSAQVGMREADKKASRDLAGLRNGALLLAEAAKAKDYAKAREVAALLPAYRTLPPSVQPRSAFLPLNRIMPMTNLMEEVGRVNLELTDYGDLPNGQWQLPGKAAEVRRRAGKLEVMTWALTTHVPEKDPDAAKGQTRRLWLEAAAEVRQVARVLGDAAEPRQQPAFQAGLKRLEAACARCHKAYRIE